MAERQENARAPGEERAAVLSLLIGSLIFGLIWYPYRILRDAGIDGVAATTLTYGVAFVVGLILFRRSLRPLPRLRLSWPLAWLALASGGCNLGYVLATLNGEVMRVLLLFYLAPLWTVLLSRLLLGERLNRFGVFVVALSLAGAASMLWHPRLGLPVPRDAADWFALGAGFSFALFNVLSRQTKTISIEHKLLLAFAGVVLLGSVLLLAGVGRVQAPAILANGLLLAVVGGVLVLANFVLQYGMARIAANRAIVIMLSELGFAAIASWLLADEAPGLGEWLGGAMIVTASLFSAKMENIEDGH